LGISELSGNGENLTIFEFEIFLTWQPAFMISQVWPRLEIILRITSLLQLVIFLMDIKDSGSVFCLMQNVKKTIQKHANLFLTYKHSAFNNDPSKYNN